MRALEEARQQATAADSFAAAAGEPKKAIWYEAGHALDARAKKGRMAWLKERLGIGS